MYTNHKHYGYTTLLILFLILSSFLSGCIQKQETIVVDGEERHYLIHVPASYNESTPIPLVLVLHGGGGNPDNIADTTHFTDKSDEEGFIVVYPQGTGRFPRKLFTWNGGFCCGYALENNIDDVLFIETLIAHLQQTYTINHSRIYATGLSNGGVMTYRLGSELSHIFAAIAPVSAQIGGQHTKEDSLWMIPEPKNPVSVMAIHGMKDTRVPYYGGQPINDSSHVYWWMSVNESIGFWVEHNECTTFPQRNISANGNIIVDTHAGGRNNTEVILVSIVNGTHAWPGGEKGWENGPEPNQDISATNMIWEFFKTHPKQNL